MYIVTNNQITTKSYLEYLPMSLSSIISSTTQENLCEIRLRKNKPVILHYCRDKFFLKKCGGLTKNPSEAYILSKTDLIRTAQLVLEFSLYAHENELSGGFITVRGGHRIGIAGELCDGYIKDISKITSMNLRIAHEHIGMAEKIKDKVILDSKILNTLIISPPMCGKTSMIRDLARIISNCGIKVGICDTRGEIAAVYDGLPSMDVGNSDIISGADKSLAMNMLLRCMSPDVIVCDEIGSKKDVDSILNIFNSGVSLIASAHSKSRTDFFNKHNMKTLAKHFDLIVTLTGVGEIYEVYYA